MPQTKTSKVIEHHLYIHGNNEDEVLTIVKQILQQGVKMSAELDRLTQDVAEIRTVVGSVITFINGLVQQLKDAGTDPAKLTALAADLEDSKQSLANAIATPGTVEPNPNA